MYRFRQLFVFKKISSSVRSYAECNVKDSVCGKLNEAMCANEAPIVDKTKVLNKEFFDEIDKREHCKVIVEGQSEIESTNGTYEGIRRSRRARIYNPPKNVMQSGTQHSGNWILDFNAKKKWENPCNGYVSGSDPIHGIRIPFKYKQDAIAFAEKNGWRWWVQETWNKKPFKIRTYASNFSYDKKTKISTK